jgi:hypothetical protein
VGRQSELKRERSPNSLLRLPESPRARKRLYRRSALAGALVVALVMVVFFRNTGTPLDSPIVGKRPIVLRSPKSVPASPAARAAAERTLDRFVRTAVIRRNPLQAWDLVTPRLRAGTTQAQWRAGLLPVVPYPAEQFRSEGATLKYSYRGILGYDVLVVPKTLRGEQRVYACELDKVHGHWLVDWCYPRKTL